METMDNSMEIMDNSLCYDYFENLYPNMDELEKRFELKIRSAEELLSTLTLNQFQVIPGILKLRKKIKKEISFLNGMVVSGKMKDEHLLSSNIRHFSSLMLCISQSVNIKAVLKTFFYVDLNGFERTLRVDLVDEEGHRWVKVIARNPKALSQVSTGDAGYGQKSILDHGIEYLACAKKNLCLFEPPQVCFNFTNGICKHLADDLDAMGIFVIGNIINNLGECCDSKKSLETFRLDNEEDSASNNSLQTCLPSNISTSSSSGRFENMKRVNLDVTTLIAYVSSLTNGGENWSFREPLLNQQAIWERERPVKPVIDEILKDRTCICCRTAYNEFLEIMRILGGPSEKARAEIFLEKVEIVDDVPFPGLKLRGKIKQRSSLIFGTGHYHKVVTVTANKGFLRAAEIQGVNIAAFVHESRALTETKQGQLIDSELSIS